MVDSEWKPECSAFPQLFPGSRQERSGFAQEHSARIPALEHSGVGQQPAVFALQSALVPERSVTAKQAFVPARPPESSASPEPALAPERFGPAPGHSVTGRLVLVHSYWLARSASWVQLEALIAPCR